MDKVKMKLYEEMRKKVDDLKELDGFKCYKCGNCCYHPSTSLTGLDENI